jgi:hypothetical protein
MSNDLWSLVDEKLNEHSYMDGVERTVERVNATAEIFTPNSLVLEILRYLDLEMLAPGKTVLDPACGDGQFLVAAKWVKVFHFGMAESDALSEIYGVDLMRDNVDLCKRRLGGGTVIMGNSLLPTAAIEGQTEEEHKLMLELYLEHSVEAGRKKRVPKTERLVGVTTLF